VDGRCIVDLAPDLLAMVHPRRWNNRTVEAALDQNAWLRDIVGALTLPMLVHYVQVKERLEAFVLDPSSSDSTV
jgi:hypothetical protein